MTDLLPDPYFVVGPALISFSGGRTSAYMLHQILAAHGGALPSDVHVTFANTGKEREETLRFVHECGERWNVPIRWLERAPEGGFVEVSHNSAARNGEPFATLIAKKGYLPNAVTRFCTIELKIRVMRDFALSLGWQQWANVIGLRYDEGARVLKALERNDTSRERFKAAMPLSKAKVTKRDVEAFWKAQPFDLGLKGYEGNCDLCFLKKEPNLRAIIRENPTAAAWWIGQESTADGGFHVKRRYADLARAVRDQGDMIDGWAGDEFDAECGLVCAP